MDLEGRFIVIKDVSQDIEAPQEDDGTLAVKAASNKAIYDGILQKLEELDK